MSSYLNLWLAVIVKNEAETANGNGRFCIQILQAACMHAAIFFKKQIETSCMEKSYKISMQHAKFEKKYMQNIEKNLKKFLSQYILCTTSPKQSGTSVLAICNLSTNQQADVRTNYQPNVDEN